MTRQLHLFPGHRAGASLKRGSWARPGSGCLLFPGHRAGASLKLARPATGLGKLGGLFPGHRAGASLKQPERPCDADRLALFPGHRAGASLKHQPPRHDARVLGLFPGHRAGASLKPAARVNRHDAAAGALPRPPSRGLIEAGCAPTRILPRAPLPRPPSRGLIEAASHRRHGGVAGTALPRPPSRGLIEAWDDGQASALRRPLFPGHRAGASLKHMSPSHCRRGA